MIDDKGNRQLIQSAKVAGVEHMILLSVRGAAPNHAIELMGMKHRAEEAVQASGLSWTIIRPTTYIETWTALVGAPLVETGKTRIFGRGTNPINFVSAHDVAQFVKLALLDPSLHGMVVEVCGPDNLTFRDVVGVFQQTIGRAGQVSHVPLPVMRMMAVAMRPINPTLARQIQGGVVMDTHDVTFNPDQWQRRFPSIPRTSLTDVVACDCGAVAAARAPHRTTSERPA